MGFIIFAANKKIFVGKKPSSCFVNRLHFFIMKWQIVDTFLTVKQGKYLWVNGFVYVSVIFPCYGKYKVQTGDCPVDAFRWEASTQN